MPVGCVRVSPNRSRIFFIIGRCSRSLGGEGGGTDWQRVGGFDSWPLDWMWMLLLPSLLPWLFVCPFPQVPISSTMLQKEAVRVDARSCVVVYIFRSVYTILPYVCASASSTYICGTVDRVSLRSRSFYWVWTAEKRFSCFYIEAIFPSRPVAFKNTDFDVPRSLAVWLLFLLLSLFSASFSLMLFLSDQSVSSTDIHSSCTRHEIRRDVLVDVYNQIAIKFYEWQNGCD